MRQNKWGIFLSLLVFFCSLMVVSSIKAGGLIQYALTDLEVLYLFDAPENIDWPTLYYLNDHYHCRINLLTVRSSEKFYHTQASVKDKQIILNEYYVNEDDPDYMDRLFGTLFT